MGPTELYDSYVIKHFNIVTLVETAVNLDCIDAVVTVLCSRVVSHGSEASELNT